MRSSLRKGLEIAGKITDPAVGIVVAEALALIPAARLQNKSLLTEREITGILAPFQKRQPLMVHHIVLLTTKPEVTAQKVEDLMVETRIKLLKIPEVNNLRVGKRIDTETNPWTYFYSLDAENMDKLAFIMESAIYSQFEKQVLKPFISEFKILNYEMEPGKDVRYS